ncbi:MAG: DUF2589 domain-containing protein [Aestuariivirga sp.]
MARRSVPTKSRRSANRSVATAGDANAQLAARQASATIAEIGRMARRDARIRPMADPNTNLVAELNNIDFHKMIGGPLQAAVDAQVASSLATVNFINSVGFTEPAQPGGRRELVMVDFSHTRKDVKADGTADNKEINVKVPLLAMLPIPSLRIEHVIIDFNVKLNSVESSSVSTSLGINASASGGFGPVKFKVSASFQRKTATNVEVKKEYALNVNVKAVQDEIPAGLEKILGLLAA